MLAKRSVDAFCIVALEYRSKATVPVGAPRGSVPVTVATSVIVEPTIADAGTWVVVITGITVASAGMAGTSPAPTSTAIAGTLAPSQPHQLPARFISGPRLLGVPIRFVGKLYRHVNLRHGARLRENK